MWYAVIFVLGIFAGAASVVTCALMVAKTRYEEATRSVKTNGDMLRTLSNKELAEFIEALSGKQCKLIWRNMKDCNTYKIIGTCKKDEIEMWLEKEADAEWK